MCNYMRIVPREVRCSKCDSGNIAKPANEYLDWEYKCLNCGHTKEKEEPVITTTTDGGDFVYYKASDLDKPIEF